MCEILVILKELPGGSSFFGRTLEEFSLPYRILSGHTGLFFLDLTCYFDFELVFLDSQESYSIRLDFCNVAGFVAFVFITSIKDFSFYQHKTPFCKVVCAKISQFSPSNNAMELGNLLFVSIFMGDRLVSSH